MERAMPVAFSRFAPQTCPFGGPCEYELYRATSDPWNDPPYLPPPYTPLMDDAAIVIGDLEADARLQRAQAIVKARSKTAAAAMGGISIPERWAGTIIQHRI
jgi:hypothetical protein